MTAVRIQYWYRGARRDGTIEFGTLDADGRESAMATLAAREVLAIEVRPADATHRYVSTLSIGDIAVGLRVLATLLESGIPIARTLSTFAELAPSRWKAGLPALRNAVREGRSLATALESQALGIPAVLVGIVRAGEAAGRLASSVRSAAELAERHAAARAALHAALAYPLVLAIAAASSIALLVGVVVPRFARILAEIGGQLPASTAAVVAVAGAARASLLPGLLCVAGLLVAWKSWVHTEQGHERWHGLLLATPGVGAVRRSAATSRFCSALAALLASGVPLAPALNHAASAIGDAALRAAAMRAREAVVEGEALSRALESRGVTTPATVRLIRAGEESGSVSVMLEHAARIERERAEHLIKAALRFLEPGMILFFGGVVALVAAALLQALYSVRPTS